MLRLRHDHFFHSDDETKSELAAIRRGIGEAKAGVLSILDLLGRGDKEALAAIVAELKGEADSLEELARKHAQPTE